MTNFFNFIYAPMRLRAFRWWILACGGGHLRYRLLLHIVLAVASPASPSPASPINDAIPFWFVFDVLLASLYLIVGGFQWLIIRKYFARPYGWLSVIALQCGVDWFIRSSFISYYPTARIFVLGLGLGLAGWLFFRDRTQHATYWIIAAVMTQLALNQVDAALVDPFFAVLSAPQNIQISILLLLFQEILRFVAQGCFTGWVLAHFITTNKQAELQYL